MKLTKIAAVLLVLASFASALERQPVADYKARRQALAKAANGGIVVLFASMEDDDAIYGFRQNNDFYYLTGWGQPDAALIIAPESGKRPYTEILFLPAHNLTGEKWTGPKLGAENPEAAKITGFDRVEVLDKLRDELVAVLPENFATVYSDLPGFGESSPSATPLQWLSRANAFPNYVSRQDVKPLIVKQRLIKDAGEVALIRKATDASVIGHFAALRAIAIKPGVTERAIHALHQYEFSRNGCERPAYSPIVGSGFNSTVLHYSESENTMKAGDVVVMDVAGEYGMYATDITRTAPVSGKFTPRQREIYDIVLGALRAAEQAFVAGKSTLGRGGDNSLFQVALNHINSRGKDKNGQTLGQYFIHGLGHYVGLEVHDPGSTSAPLAPGMVFTMEPGIYIPEESLGVRIENTYWVDPQGKLVNLSERLPVEAAEVERVMAGGK
jgi:Xaa-Pro aminopeptidase